MDSAYFNLTILDNTLADYFRFGFILFAGLFLRRFVSGFISRLLFLIFKNYGREIGLNRFIDLLRAPIQFLVMILVVYAAFYQLTFPTGWRLERVEQFGLRHVLFNIFKGLIVISSFWIFLRTIDFVGLVFLNRAKYTGSKTDDQLVPFVKEAVKVIVAGIGLLVFLGVAFELDVVSLLTGLGIGGLAFALAAKETLENLLGSFTIFLDKPFVVGDYIKVGQLEGKVESIGFRSTRIRSVERTLITVPNKKLVDAELTNETDRTVRRSFSSLLLSFESTSEVLDKLMNEIRSYLYQADKVDKDSVIVTLRQFKQEGIELQVIYLVHTPDFIEFLSLQEKNHLRIMSMINRQQIQFAESDHFKIPDSKEKA